MVGYGCMTCIGNSGPLPESVVEAITQVCSFSCAAHLCKLLSAVCCFELYYTVYCLFSALYKINSVYILFSVGNVLGLSKRQFCDWSLLLQCSEALQTCSVCGFSKHMTYLCLKLRLTGRPCGSGCVVWQ